MDKSALQVGGKYNWRNQSERLEYMGIKHYNGDRRDWHQFSLIGIPNSVWCEVLDHDLEHFEATQ